MTRERISNFPTWALNYIFNDEPGDLTKEEIDGINLWMDAYGVQGLSVVTDEEGDINEYFSRCPVIGECSCDCVDVDIIY